MNECEYCRDPETAVTIFRQSAGKQHHVQAILDASPSEAAVTFSVVRTPGAVTGRKRQFLTGFAINFCPFCGRKLRDDNNQIKQEK